MSKSEYASCVPSGCEFNCKNEKCSCFKTGFVMTSPWGMAKIDDVINSTEDKEHKDFLEKVKVSGRTLACLVYPNVKKIETEAYRVQMWSPEAKCIWEYHVSSKNPENKKTWDGQIPEKCPTTGCDLLSFQEVIEAGIKCPICNEDLSQNRWFAKGEV